jgi:phosphatidylglycerophosphatase C
MAAEPYDERMHGQPVPHGDVVAAFDFDGTLTRGGSVWQFLTTVRGRSRVVAAGFVVAPKLALALLVGGRWVDAAKEALFVWTLKGLPADDVARQAAAFGTAHFHHRSRTAVLARLDWHRRQGHHVVIVSASPEYYVGPVARALGAQAVVATRLAIDDRGRLTGRFDGGNCRGAHKVSRLTAWMKASLPPNDASPNNSDGQSHLARQASGGTPRGRPFLWAYGNSAGDRELLEAADIGVDAGRLGRFGKLRRFRRLGEVLTAW